MPKEKTNKVMELENPEVVEKFSENALLGLVPDSALIDDSLIRNQSCNDISYSAYVEFIF